MRAKDIVGKTIRRIQQERFQSTSGAIWSLEAIEFTDGTTLRFLVAEGEDVYGVEPVYPAKPIVGADQAQEKP